MTPAADSILVGIDENGLGSRLGPMIVTAVRLGLSPAMQAPTARFKRMSAAGIGDSKARGGFGAMAAMESRVLALLRVHGGHQPSSLTDLMARVCDETETSLRSDCPAGEAPLACFSDPVSIPAFGPGIEPADQLAAEALLQAGVRIEKFRVAVLCAQRINHGRNAGRSRFDLDLAAMIRHARALVSAEESARVTVMCGKVGGRARYASAFDAIAPLTRTIIEGPACSSYDVPGLGQVHFARDADATESAVGAASMVGKYVRELWMLRHNRYWASRVDGVPTVSGYHDPTTEKLVVMVEPTRRRLQIVDACFER